MKLKFPRNADTIILQTCSSRQVCQKDTAQSRPLKAQRDSLREKMVADMAVRDTLASLWNNWGTREERGIEL